MPVSYEKACFGAAWRDMPDRFGPWSTVYQRFRGWRKQGTFDQMLKRLHLRLNEQGLIDLQTWMIDSTAVRATRASSGAGKKRRLTGLPITLYGPQSRRPENQNPHALRRQQDTVALSSLWRSSQ